MWCFERPHTGSTPNFAPTSIEFKRIDQILNPLKSSENDEGFKGHEGKYSDDP